MDYPIYRGEQAAGTLHMVKDGLYYRLTASCAADHAQVYRLYGIRGLQSTCLGVLMPEENGELFTLTRQISVRAMPERPERILMGAPQEDYLPWQGQIDGEDIPWAYLRTDGDKTFLAIPYKTGEPFALAHRLSHTVPATLAGETYLVVELADGHLPVAPEDTTPAAEESIPSVDDPAGAVEPGGVPGLGQTADDNAQLGIGGVDEAAIADVDAHMADVGATG